MRPTTTSKRRSQISKKKTSQKKSVPKALTPKKGEGAAYAGSRGGKPQKSGRRRHDEAAAPRSSTNHRSGQNKTRSGRPGAASTTPFIPRPPGSKRPPARDEQAASAPVSKRLEKARQETSSQLAQWREAGLAIREAKRTMPTGGPALTLDPWQQDAVDALISGSNVVVDAPTTAGKTRVVEAYIAQHIDDPGFRACYTCPVKSLSTDKLREFRAIYGRERVGIATGDIKENLDAPIVVATLESYRNSLLGVEPDLGRKLVIYDEYHYLQDEGRGSAWEESIILTPPECQMLLLSASLSNASEFADWLEQLTGRSSVLITAGKRPVPLVDMVWQDGEWFVAASLPPAVLGAPRRDTFLEPLGQQDIADRLVGLLGLGLTPCIVYAGKRLSCEHLAKALASRLDPLPEKDRQAVGEALQRADADNRVFSFMTPQIRQLIQTYGVAYHHSGLTPPLRVTIERLVKEGLLRFCTATMGLSLGINFSVKATVISDALRPGEAGFTPYGSSEVLQMTGRAGRRGMDAVGFSCWPNDAYYHRYAQAEREPCSSRLRNDPTTFLGLISRGYQISQIEHFYRKSFLKFQTPRVDVQLVAAPRLRKSLGADELPCRSPAHEYSAFLSAQNALCYDCSLQKKCHALIDQHKASRLSLAALHLHLHKIGALDAQDKLTPLGELARFFPQAGGLLIARMIVAGEITADSLLATCQLMAALSLARYKMPNEPAPSYQFPFVPTALERDLRLFYPAALFGEAYDTPRGRPKGEGEFKEFNPAAGYVIKLWAEGLRWPDLLRQVSNEQYGAGDTMALIYRTASYLQSLVQAHVGELSTTAKELREFLLREPLQLASL